MPGWGKASIASICNYILFLEGDKWFPTMGFIVHQIARMLKKLSHIHIYCHFSNTVWIHGYIICTHITHLWMYTFNLYILKMQLQPLVKELIIFFNHQHSSSSPTLQLKFRTEARLPELEFKPCHWLLLGPSVRNLMLLHFLHLQNYD